MEGKASSDWLQGRKDQVNTGPEIPSTDKQSLSLNHLSGSLEYSAFGFNYTKGPFDSMTPFGPLLNSNETVLGNITLTSDTIERIIKSTLLNTNLSNFDHFTQVTLIVAFAILIVFGATGNSLVCYVVAKNPTMRTPRNIFIINLAISDLSLCLFTQPFNLMKVSMNRWTLGVFMCKFVPMFAGTNVFVSTISITAIALDRFQVIVYPTKDSMRTMGAFIALFSIWGIALLMASPMLIFNVTQNVEPLPGLVLYQVCVENPRLHYEKGAYSIASMVFQYIVPILIVTVAHARICNKLKYRMVNQQPQVCINSPFQKRKNEREAKRKRKTNMLLVMIATMFASSWMPLNVFNIMADFNGALLQDFDKKGLVFPICHLLVLSSACTNPVMYGWLNDNFRREFEKVLCWPCCRNIRVIFDCRNTLPCCQTEAQTTRDTSVVIYTKANNGNVRTLDVEQTQETKTFSSSKTPPQVDANVNSVACESQEVISLKS